MKTIILYHGSISTNNFNTFRLSKHGYLGQGVYFTDTKEIAKKYALKYGYGQIIKASININENEILKICSSDSVNSILEFIYPNKNVYKQRKEKQSNESYLIEKRDINKLVRQGIKLIEWKLPLSDDTEYLILDKNDIKILDREIVSNI